MKNLQFKIFAYTCLIAFISCSTVCYDDLGCFTNEYPFGGPLRPISYLPESPQKMNVTFFLYTRLTSSPELISYKSINRYFNPNLPTKIIAHGWLDTSFELWIIDMKNALLEVGDYNVIAVDWGNGAQSFQYQLAAANTQIAGAETARLIQSLINNSSASVESFHLIGHSLGAHVCGYAAKRVKGITRISGLDPASPYFEDTEPIVRLDINDASFVDIIHTAGQKFVGDFFSIGFLKPLGDVDFYPNGGKQQPGCNIMTPCSHLASERLYIDSIRNVCQFDSQPCNSIEDFQSGLCLKCGPNGCNRMGFWSSPDKDLNSLYLVTKSINVPEKCIQNYLVTLISPQTGAKKAKGYFTLVLQTKNESSSQILDKGTIEFSSGDIHTQLVSLDKPLNDLEIESVRVVYERSIFDAFVYEKTWTFETVEIFSAVSQKIMTFCPIGRFLTFATSVVYRRC